MKRMLFCAAASMLAGGSLTALAGTFEAWGHSFTYDDFRPVMMNVTVATEKGTGHKMTLVKMKNGHMMALVPADRFLALMPSSTGEGMEQ